MTTQQSLGKKILDESIGDDELRTAIFEEISKDELVSQVESLSKRVSGRRSEVFAGVVKRYGYLRKFSTVLVEALAFSNTSQGATSPCLEALETLRQVNADAKRKLPEEVHTGFVPRTWEEVVCNNGHTDRHAWECALLVKLRDEIKAGNISIRHSKRFGRFDDFFISDAQWQGKKDGFFHRAGLPSNPQDVPSYLTQRLASAYDRFFESAPQNTYAQVNESGWQLSTDSAQKMDDD